MAFTTWSPKTAYYQPGKKSSGCGPTHESHHSGCGCGGSCDECKKKGGECGCPPPGTVKVIDPATGEFVGFLTPNDAEGWLLNDAIPPAGYVKWIVDGVFMGFITPEQYLELNP